jgi:hypothetical protein
MFSAAAGCGMTSYSGVQGRRSQEGLWRGGAFECASGGEHQRLPSGIAWYVFSKRGVPKQNVTPRRGQYCEDVS